MAGQDFQQLLWLMHCLLDQQVLCLQPVTFLHPREQVCAWTGGRRGGGGFISSVTHIPVCTLPCECSVPSWLVPVESISKPRAIVSVHLVMLRSCRCSQGFLIGLGLPCASETSLHAHSLRLAQDVVLQHRLLRRLSFPADGWWRSINLLRLAPKPATC